MIQGLIPGAVAVYATAAYVTLCVFVLCPDATRINYTRKDRDIALVLSALWPVPWLLFAIYIAIKVGDWCVAHVKKALNVEAA